MRQSVRAIIIHENKLLVMHRNKLGKEYVTLPGGTVERGETLEQALIREIHEETSMSFKRPRLIFIEHAPEPYGDQYVFLCDYVSGDPVLHPESEEILLNKAGENLHHPDWLLLQELPDAIFRSDDLKQHILTSLEQGWPAKTIEFTPK